MQFNLTFASGRGALLFGLLASFAAPSLLAQGQSQWTTVMYRKSEPGKAAEHRKFIETTWTKLAQSMVDDGTNSGAVAMRLTQPYSANADFDYVTVSFAARRPSVAPLPAATQEARARKAGFESWQKFLDAANANSRVVRQEWLTTNLRLGGARVGNYMRLQRYDVPREHYREYSDFQQEYLIPLQSARVKDGGLQGFSIHQPAMVSYDEAGFTHSVSWILKDAEAAMAGPARINEETFNRLLPGKSYRAYVLAQNSVNSHRKTVATRLYEVLAVVGAMPQAAPSPTGQ
jgi:hypothetical protein